VEGGIGQKQKRHHSPLVMSLFWHVEFRPLPEFGVKWGSHQKKSSFLHFFAGVSAIPAKVFKRGKGPYPKEIWQAFRQGYYCASSFVREMTFKVNRKWSKIRVLRVTLTNERCLVIAEKCNFARLNLKLSGLKYPHLLPMITKVKVLLNLAYARGLI